MRLDIADVVGGYGPIGQRVPDHRLLGGAIGDCQAAGAAILVDCRTADDGEDGVAGALGVVQPFEEHHAAPFATYISISCGVKGFTAAIG